MRQVTCKRRSSGLYFKLSQLFVPLLSVDVFCPIFLIWFSSLCSVSWKTLVQWHVQFDSVYLCIYDIICGQRFISIYQYRWIDKFLKCLVCFSSSVSRMLSTFAFSTNTFSNIKKKQLKKYLWNPTGLLRPWHPFRNNTLKSNLHVFLTEDK